jgi:hypothetical protein
LADDFVQCSQESCLKVAKEADGSVSLASEVVDCAASVVFGKRKLSQLIGGFVGPDDFKKVKVFGSYSP